MAAGFAVLPRLQAQGTDDQYVRVYNLIQEADGLSNHAQPAEALGKYLEAQTALQRFQRGNPDWNVAVVKFRLNYLAAKIAAITPKVPPPPAPSAEAPGKPASVPAPGAGPSQPPKPAPPADWETQLGALREQVRLLQSETVLLESKLKEALAAQPAAVDPRELAKAQDKIKSMQKENDLLNVRLAQEKAKPAPTADSRALELSQQALAEANRKLAEQTSRANNLAQEKQFLQNKLSVLAPGEENATALAATRKALAQANAKLSQQTVLASRMALEKDALQSRVRALSLDGGAAAALRAENLLLKKQLADLSAAAPSKGQDEDARQLALARAQVAALQSDKENLRLEKMALEMRVRQLSSGTQVAAAPAGQGRAEDARQIKQLQQERDELQQKLASRATIAASPAPAPSRAEDARQIKQLRQERDDLQKKLESAIKEMYGHKGQETAARVDELEGQVATLRARLEVFEARQVPYSPEELALFQRPETKLAEPDPKAGKKSAKELPAGSLALVAEAQRFFANRQLDQAEQDYTRVLHQDAKNVYTLANLAAIQLERGRLEEAEKNIKQALALAPEDVYSLSILGQLRFRQDEYQAALDALSRAAKLDPQNAEIQNYLGITLSQLGMRGPAETALRKAIQLEPGYGGAHHNLAVIYLTQKPPLVELARWHYQKALAAGHPRNPELEKMLEVRPAIE